MATDDHSVFIDGPRHRVEDRAAVIEAAGGWVVVVIDGAGGIGDGAHAAEFVLARFRDHLEADPRLDDEAAWVDFLAAVDVALASGGDSEFGFGEAAAVVLAATPDGLRGASVGDCEAWLHTQSGWDDLTASQRRRPMLGSGAARPVGFARPACEGLVLAGTDGLFKYAPRDRLLRLALAAPCEAACRALVDQVRLGNGTLQDDATAVLCRFRFGP